MGSWDACEAVAESDLAIACRDGLSDISSVQAARRAGAAWLPTS